MDLFRDNTGAVFHDRKDAAMRLSEALSSYRNKHALVLGIPRGGAVTGYHVAKFLNADFSLLISRKLGHPFNPEYAIGALAEDGTVHINEHALAEVSQDDIDQAVATQKKEIERRIQILRKGKPLPEIRDKTVIIVDDGIATGATIFAAIEMCRKKKASRIVVAAPVSGTEKKEELARYADDVIILEIPEFYHAVSQVYDSFQQVSDAEALELLERWEAEQKTTGTQAGQAFL
jgi:predicted phosphoribosyltransferase